MREIEQLFDRVISINLKYRDELCQDNKRNFNIFSILRKEDDEVNLHSRFLFELVNPKGTHGLGSSFLELFLQQIGIADFELTTVYAKREHRGIDIFIANAKHAIIIENKVYALDQPRQLQRYYEGIVQEGFDHISVVYLTLDGEPPSAQSLGTLDRDLITTISYRDEIRNWLGECIKAARANPAVKEIITQYQRLVEKLVGWDLGRGLMDIKELLIDENRFSAAMSISQALTEVKIDMQYSFWTGLEEKLVAEGFATTDLWKYTREKVSKYYRKSPREYGLVSNLSALSERETLTFTIFVHHQVYFTIGLLRDGKPGPHSTIPHKPYYDRFTEALNSLDVGWFRQNDYEFGKRPLNQRIDFYHFNTPHTLALIDPSKRALYIDELVDEIILGIDQFYQVCAKRDILRHGIEYRKVR